ncbi:hypothetical protein FRX31_018164 [Thalictrum thalictroides]|uniref:Polyphenol oxidase C-terminal domain-containing protein n=1 Tax=Thalictrum thalictroides TaxID=46969 RepID=A0A7J6W630_THATH|nr:hypothetical protein FRX31_018164 [Thalictrum thalictroides]
MALTSSLLVPLHHSTLETSQIPFMIKSLKPIQTSNKKFTHEDPKVIINRRRVIFISLGCGVRLYSQSLIGTAEPMLHSLPFEFQPQPQIIDRAIRVLVSRPQEAVTKSGRGSKLFEVLVVDGIEVPYNEPVKFNVYIEKMHNGVGPEFGVFAGSLVNMAFPCVGGSGEKGMDVKSKGNLELGITGLVEDIGAQHCDIVAVSLVPSLGPVVIRGFRIEAR